MSLPGAVKRGRKSETRTAGQGSLGTDAAGAARTARLRP